VGLPANGIQGVDKDKILTYPFGLQQLLETRYQETIEVLASLLWLDIGIKDIRLGRGAKKHIAVIVLGKIDGCHYPGIPYGFFAGVKQGKPQGPFLNPTEEELYPLVFIGHTPAFSHLPEALIDTRNYCIALSKGRIQYLQGKLEKLFLRICEQGFIDRESSVQFLQKR
jgi:hypothetical protein